MGSDKVVLRGSRESIAISRAYLGSQPENGVMDVIIKYPEMVPWKLGYELKFEIYLAIANSRVWALRGDSLVRGAIFESEREGLSHYSRVLGSRSGVLDIFRFIGVDGAIVTAKAIRGRSSFVVTRGLGDEFSVQYACEVSDVADLKLVDEKIVKFIGMRGGK